MVAKTDPTYQGAQLFQQHCSGCHTLSVAGTQGSRGPEVKYAERNQGPNLNTRPESPNNVLFAIRNGGFSGAIMPSNVVVGQDAQQVAAFVSKYAGHGPQG
jgi:mono/diheme cytochrome c family protein